MPHLSRARRTEVLDMVAAKLSSDTAANWEARLRPLGIPAAAVRSLPEALEATPEAIVTAGDHRLIGSPIKVAGFTPSYRAAPQLDEYSREPHSS